MYINSSYAVNKKIIIRAFQLKHFLILYSKKDVYGRKLAIKVSIKTIEYRIINDPALAKKEDDNPSRDSIKLLGI
jgi:hypothetical protein